ncbi:MAG TPA: S41 family peptidase [Longimicrobiaceae bacterium]|nr:S41 family peptidase [Longimicrobiaceae bacterium]
MRRLLPGLILALALPVGAPAQGGARPASAECIADLDSLETVVRRDYSGFRTKAQQRASGLAAVTDSVRAAARAAPDPDACTAALQRWIAWFRDPHMEVWEPKPRPTAGQDGAARPSAPPEDPRRPSLRFADDSTAVLRLGDFGDRYKPAIDSLVAAHRARLLATPYLVVDVRENGGGWTGSYESVLPLLYTRPILVHGMEAWASEGNVAYMREMLASDRAEGIKRVIRDLLPKMEASRDRFVTISEDREIRLDTVHPMPRAVAVLTSRRCASSCEQFVLDARQSDKVTVIGTENTRGMLDYGNSRRVQLPSGKRVLQVPTSRSRRLPDDPLDVVGIAPEVRVPEDEPDPVEFARRHLRSRS